MTRALAIAAIAWGLLACGPTTPDRQLAGLQVITDPPNARVTVDDRFAGIGQVLASRAVALDPGRHLVTIEASGYFPHDLELDLPVGVTTVEVHLRPIPP